MVANLVHNSPNFLGPFHEIAGNGRTPLLEIVGGLQGGGFRIVGGLQYPEAVTASLVAGSQPDIDETDSLTAPAPSSRNRSVVDNFIQIHQRSCQVSYLKSSVPGFIKADSATDLVDSTQPMNVSDEKAFQVDIGLRQFATDFEWTGIQGVKQKPSDATTAGRSGGLLEAGFIQAEVAAGAADLSKVMINSCLKAMVDGGAPMIEPMIICNSYNKQRISTLYGYAPESRNVGGVDIRQIETDFAVLPVLYVPNMPHDDVLILDVAHLMPVSLPKDGQVIVYEDLAKTGASDQAQLYMQVGWDRGDESFHGKITDTKTA